MGFEKRTSWVSDLKRNRNLPSPEEAVRMCQLLNTTPEKILMHEGKDEKETAKCQEDIKRVQELLEQAEQKESAPGHEAEGDVEQIVDFVRAASKDEVAAMKDFAAYLKSKREQT